MKEIRQIYMAQKKKDVQHHFMLVWFCLLLLVCVCVCVCVCVHVHACQYYIDLICL